MKSCCVPQRTGAAANSSEPVANTLPPAVEGLTPLVHLPGGEFLMGTDSAEGFAEDGEGPRRPVRLSPFAIGATAVTNRQFREFVRATSYITEAEQIGSSFVFYLHVEPQRRRSLRQVSRELPWWVPLEGACWQRPAGPGSAIHDRLDHPVVHVSWNDAAAYCAWAKLRLPTEAEWEYAARGGLVQRLYPWGDEFEEDGRARCNTWQGRFPSEPAPGWQPGSVPVASYPANGYGLYDMAGNVWEWCTDWFDPNYHRNTSTQDPLQGRMTGRRSQRGGSFLCHASYCNRYRVAARGSNTPGSSASNCGFRVVGAMSAIQNQNAQ